MALYMIYITEEGNEKHLTYLIPGWRKNHWTGMLRTIIINRLHNSVNEFLKRNWNHWRNWPKLSSHFKSYSRMATFYCCAGCCTYWFRQQNVSSVYPVRTIEERHFVLCMSHSPPATLFEFPWFKWRLILMKLGEKAIFLINLPKCFNSRKYCHGMHHFRRICYSSRTCHSREFFHSRRNLSLFSHSLQHSL